MAPVHRRTPWVLIGTRSEIRHQPRGVVLILSPWNYPVNLTLAPLVAAVAAGNCVMLKPSERAPHTASALGRLVADVFDSSEVACVTGGREVVETLLTFPFDHFFFTGASEKGRAVMRAAAEHLASVTLELGGKSPALVHEDAAIADAAERIVWGKWLNAGQTCIAPDYVLVHERQKDAFVACAVRVVERFTNARGAPTDDFTRVVDDAARQRLASMLDAAVRDGARVATGGIRRHDRFMGPTILTDVRAATPLMQEEIFGPILPVLPYRTLDDAIAFVRDRPSPLALYVFSRNSQVFDDVVRQTAAGGSVWNHVVLQFANPYLPFGAGLGAYHGEFGFRAFSRERALVLQQRFSATRWFYPPYGQHTRRRLGWLQRLTGR
jgi:aldehyde dehydrogenase (NAD+)